MNDRQIYNVTAQLNFQQNKMLQEIKKQWDPSTTEEIIIAAIAFLHKKINEV